MSFASFLSTNKNIGAGKVADSNLLEQIVVDALINDNQATARFRTFFDLRANKRCRFVFAVGDDSEGLFWLVGIQKLPQRFRSVFAVGKNQTRADFRFGRVRPSIPFGIQRAEAVDVFSHFFGKPKRDRRRDFEPFLQINGIENADFAPLVGMFFRPFGFTPNSTRSGENKS